MLFKFLFSIRQMAINKYLGIIDIISNEFQSDSEVYYKIDEGNLTELIVEAADYNIAKIVAEEWLQFEGKINKLA